MRRREVWDGRKWAFGSYGILGEVLIRGHILYAEWRKDGVTFWDARKVEVGEELINKRFISTNSETEIRIVAIKKNTTGRKLGCI